MDGIGHQAGRRNTRTGGAIAAAPILLALAFMVMASLDLADAAMTGPARDTGHARAVSGPLTEALARAVRGMVGIQTQRPVARNLAASQVRGRGRMEAIAPAGPTLQARHFVRDGLLNLPPPATRA